MNNFTTLQKKFENKNYCIVLVNGEYFYIDFAGHLLSKISGDFVTHYTFVGMEEIIALDMSHSELIDTLPGFTEEDD